MMKTFILSSLKKKEISMFGVLNLIPKEKFHINSLHNVLMWNGTDHQRFVSVW